MKNYPAVALAAAICLAAGCAPKPTFVGTWNTTIQGRDGQSVAAVLTFTADGHETQTNQMGAASMGVSGTYTASNGNLVQKFDTITIGKASKTLRPDQVKSIAVAYTLSGNTLTVTSPTTGTQVILTRTGS